MSNNVLDPRTWHALGEQIGTLILRNPGQQSLRHAGVDATWTKNVATHFGRQIGGNCRVMPSTAAFDAQYRVIIAARQAPHRGYVHDPGGARFLQQWRRVLDAGRA